MTNDDANAEQTSRKIKALTAERDILKAALESIASNTCCGECQEAKRVAVKALKESACPTLNG